MAKTEQKSEIESYVQQLKTGSKQDGQDDEQPPSIFRLHFYGFEGVFDCLSLLDIVAAGQTCNHLLNFARTYFKLTFQSAEVICGINGLFIKNVQIMDFIQQIKTIGIWLKGIENLPYQELVSVENINLYHTRIVPFILPATFARNIKMIKLQNCICSGDFHDSFLNNFDNLERLHIESKTYENSIIGANNRWLHGKYPKLKYFGLELGAASLMEDLMVFLLTNSQITNFSISSTMFSANYEAFLKSTIKLTVLTIKFSPWDTVVRNARVKELFADVIKLQTQKFCQKLTLIFEYCFIDNHIIDQLALLNLTELQIDQSVYIINHEVLAKRFTQLEKLVFGFAFSDDILPYIRLSTKLTDLTTKSLGRGKYLQNDILDLKGLSSIRRKIGLKLTLFIGEDIYICTKNGTEYSDSLLIELKRLESKLQ